MSKKKAFGCVIKIIEHGAGGRILATSHRCPLGTM